MGILSQIALQAQKQCRATLLALVDIKRPNRTIFVRQQNNAFNQKVNCSENNLSEKISTNELLTESIYETLDTGGALETIKTNKALDAMEISGGKD